MICSCCGLKAWFGNANIDTSFESKTMVLHSSDLQDKDMCGQLLSRRRTSIALMASGAAAGACSLSSSVSSAEPASTRDVAFLAPSVNKERRSGLLTRRLITSWSPVTVGAASSSSCQSGATFRTSVAAAGLALCVCNISAGRRPGRCRKITVAATQTQASVKDEEEQDEDDEDDEDDEEEDEEDDVDRRDWSDLLPSRDDLEKVDEDGVKWVLVKNGKLNTWKKESEVGIYRYTDRGYESKNENGEWVDFAQMPQDVTHLTDAQRERLIKELSGEMTVSMSADDPDFIPKPHVPPLEKWPFYSADITDDVIIADKELKEYRVLEMTEDLGRAFFLCSRWRNTNESRRSLGYNVNDSLEDVARLNSTVLALKSMDEQLKRAQRYRQREPDCEEPEPSDAVRLKAIRSTALLGTQYGSALAMWVYNPLNKRASIDICVGDDSMDQGPYAEEMLLRYLFKVCKEIGAEKVWCRTRRTESGKVLVPKYFPKLGFTAVPVGEQDDEVWETTTLEREEEIVEHVKGLQLWMSTRGLEKHLKAANEWCIEMGAADINEVAENKVDLADNLALSPDERDQLLAY